MDPSPEEIDGALDSARFAELAYEALARAAHRLRGGCLSIGAMHLASACAAAERAVRAHAGDGEEAGAADGLDAHADAVDRAWQATRIALLRTLP
jgi:HPt (histidine-containing phosphotransfer) domain-containing protein